MNDYNNFKSKLGDDKHYMQEIDYLGSEDSQTKSQARLSGEATSLNKESDSIAVSNE